MFYLDENVERARVTINGAFAFTVLRSTRLREEYEKWWNSEDGLEFRAALNDKDAEMLSQFDLPDDFVHRSRPPPHDSQNLYANSERVGYKFV
jgi:negative regulator of sigma E activity